MLGEKCTNLLLSLDGVESHGSDAVRKERKALVNRILHFQDYCIATHVFTFSKVKLPIGKIKEAQYMV